MTSPDRLEPATLTLESLLALIPEEFAVLRATLPFVFETGTDAALSIERVQGWVDELTSGTGASGSGREGLTGTELEDQIRDDIVKHVIGRDALMATYNLSEEQADRVMLGSNEGGLDLSAVKAGETVPKGPDSTRAIPRDARLVAVTGAGYRVVWDLGDGLGSAWYSISFDQIKQLWGQDWEQYVSQRYANEGTFEAQHGNYFWGNIAEVSRTADTPWQDLKDRIFSTFGYVSGLDTPEIRRLVLQGYFEDWTTNEFIGQYQQTDYFNSLSDTARAWSTKSEAEKAAAIRAKAGELVNLYRSQWGNDPEGGLENTDIIDSATAILTGTLTQEEWDYNTRTSAETSGDTPASQAASDLEREKGEESVTISNLTGLARDMWRRWMGPTEMPSDFADRWGHDLYWNRKSEADLELALMNLSQGTWEDKPENVTWEEWSSPVKSKMRNLLELPSVGDEDPLLADLMARGLTGQEAAIEIRKDPRFRGTQRLFNEMSSAAENLGRTFGYIA